MNNDLSTQCMNDFDPDMFLALMILNSFSGEHTIKVGRFFGLVWC
jgi:hypothetical protein